jgi:shikimate dehydrogenase
MSLFALLGFPLENSFSKDYFTQKFDALKLPHAYINLSWPDLKGFNKWVAAQTDLRGMNVTRPYKEQIIPYLHELSEEAALCGAVNCIKFEKGKRIGYNTDVLGFKNSLLEMLSGVIPKKALVIGNGGASKAVIAALKQLEINFLVAARNPKNSDEIPLEYLTHGHFIEHQLIVNTTPVGMYPKVNEVLDIPYDALTSWHYCYDLIYLPATTKFLEKAQRQGAKVSNGLRMLHLQADLAWEIWQDQNQ